MIYGTRNFHALGIFSATLFLQSAHAQVTWCTNETTWLSSTANSTICDFDDLSDGDQITTQYPGVTFSSTITGQPQGGDPASDPSLTPTSPPRVMRLHDTFLPGGGNWKATLDPPRTAIAFWAIDLNCETYPSSTATLVSASGNMFQKNICDLHPQEVGVPIHDFVGVTSKDEIASIEVTVDGSDTVVFDDFRMADFVPTIMYVDADAAGAGDGSTWCDAFNNPQDALAVTCGGTIRVAQGTYMPDGGRVGDAGFMAGTGDRTATFQLLNGVTLEGSYAGCGAPDPDARDIAAYETILSGDLAGDDTTHPCPAGDSDCSLNGGLCADGFCIIADNNGENSYHVVTGSGTDPTAEINGVTITRGSADSSAPHGSGAGMINVDGSPTVTDCMFMSNFANTDGGGMSNTSAPVGSNPTVTDCAFVGNSVKIGGGGGMHNNMSHPKLSQCTFGNNSSTENLGGGMFNNTSSNPTIESCTFLDNRARTDGGGMLNVNDSSPLVTNCEFESNSAGTDIGGRGGAVYNAGGAPRFLACSFRTNFVTFYGAAVYNNSSSATFSECDFVGNDAWGDSAHGGAIYSAGTVSPSVLHCKFFGNSAHVSGGALVDDGSRTQLVNSIFTGNTAGEAGGAINVVASTASITNCAFTGNSANGDGGGMNIDYSMATIVNCTFAQNIAGGDGGGIRAGVDPGNPAPVVLNADNSVFWNNQDSGGTDESAQIFTFSGISTVNYSIVQGGWTGGGGIGNKNADPLFVDADGADDIPRTDDDDLRLSAGSPAIDAADTTALPADTTDLDGDGDTTERIPFDLAGNPRVLDDPSTPDTGVPGSPVVDMGAYEFFADCNGNGVPDECDIANCPSGDATCQDCNGNLIPDECDITDCPAGAVACVDCNANGIPDECDGFTCDDGVACTKDACDSITGCSYTPSDANCADNDVCDGLETCDPVLDCQPGTPLNCDDGVACTKDACDPITGCSYTPSDANCDNNDVCDGLETCDPVLDCQPGTPLNCDDGVACTKDACDPITGCSNTPSDANCADNDVCDGLETCDPVLDCQPGTPLNCDDGVACTKDACDPITGCSNTPSDTNCDNNDVCDGLETCDPVLDCQPGTPLNCDDGVACTKDACDPITGCSYTPVDADCDDGNECTNDTCHEIADCEYLPVPDGSPCDGGLCNGGFCVCPPSSTPEAVEILDSDENPKVLTANRFLIFTAGDSGRSQAIRVTPTNLPPPFDVWNGVSQWVSAPRAVSEAGAAVDPADAPGFGTFQAARLECPTTPHCMDWSTVGPINVFGEAIIPIRAAVCPPFLVEIPAAYDIQVIDCVCDRADEGSYSAPLAVTQPIWGDTVLDLAEDPPLPPNGPPVDVVDSLAILERFSNAPGAMSKARADLEPGCLDLTINVSDALSSIQGFSGVGYRFTPTASGPCASTCPNPLP